MKGTSLWAILALTAINVAEKEASVPECHRYGVTEKQEAWIGLFCHALDRKEGRYVAE